MTIDEMHIKVEQDLQKIASYASANVLPEEIDFHLNYFTKKFVDNVVGNLKRNPTTATDFQHNQRLLDSLSTLQVKNFKLNAYTDKDNTDNLVYSIFPPNYRHLIKDVSELVYDCNNKAKVKVDSYNHMHLLSFLADEESIESLELKKEGETIFNLTNHKSYENGIDDVDAKYQLVRLILDNVPEVYWEYYNDQYYKNSFILITKLDGVVAYTLNGTTTITVPKKITNKVYRYTSEDKYVRKPNRLTKDTNLDTVLIHPFEKTVWESPVSTLGNGVLYVYEDNTFKVKHTYIDYLREPIQVSKGMSVNSDLPDTAQMLIVEQVIIHLKAIIQDPTWQTSMQHNQLNNQ